MVGWYHRLNGHEFQQTPGDSEGQGSLGYCSPWSWKVRHDRVTEQQQNLYTTYLQRVKFSPVQSWGLVLGGQTGLGSQK